MNRAFFVVATLLTASISTSTFAQRLVEKLDRGVVAIHQPDGSAFVSWRLLGTDPDEIAFNVYRQQDDGAPDKLNEKPIEAATIFSADKPNFSGQVVYSVRPVVKSKELPADGAFKLAAGSKPQAYLSIPLQPPAPVKVTENNKETVIPYRANDASAGDLDGDGQYELVVHMTGRGHDNSHNGPTEPPILQGYKLDGTLLWTINLGKNIREGAHYTQFMVFDLDSDGKAEIVCKTADGTTDAAGKVIGDANANYVNDAGRILAGPEFLTVFDGQTGKALATTDYIPTRAPSGHSPTGDEMKKTWGDGYGNRGDRFLACVAYLDGVHPSVVMCRGYYTRTVLAAWDWRDGKLTSRWVFDSATPGNEKWGGQGNHNLSVADVDDDGKDEIVYGAMCIDDDGKGLYNTTLGHGDAMHLGDLDPDHPGLEVFRIQERFDDAGAHMYDARTGQVLWRKPSVKAATTGGDKGEGPGRGVCFDVDPRYPGSESWTFGAGIEGMWDAKGNLISNVKPNSCNFAVWWDGDLLRELLDKNHVSKWNWDTQKVDRIFTADECTSINGTKANPSLSADLIGDWREEIVWPTTDDKELRIYTTTIPTETRLPTLMHDPEYRLAIAWQNVAYNQPPHPSFYLGAGMKTPPKAKIKVIGTN
jgi:rhamnogalacturonan endolyase